MTSPAIHTEPHFKPTLGLLDATMIVAGSMIGSGIFIVSADIMRNVGNAWWLLIVWLITGVMTLIAAISYGELSAMFPKAGGQYVYLKEAYNPLTGFVYGWSFFAVIQTGTIAAVSVAFAKYAGYFWPALNMSKEHILFSIGTLNIYPAQLIAIFSIVLLTWINSKGVKEGKKIQTFFTISKLIALFGLLLLGFLLVKDGFFVSNFSGSFQAMQDLGTKNNNETLVAAGWQNISGIAIAGAIAAAMTGALFSSVAWESVTFIAGEIKNPKRNVGLSLALGASVVTLIYISVNLMYLHVLPLQEIAYPQEDRIAVAAAGKIFSTAGPAIIAALIMVSTFGCNNGLVLSGARVFYTMANDDLFFKSAGTLNRYAVPHKALWIQAIMASALCLSGRYGDLLDMVSIVVVVFYMLTIGGIFILRKKRPDAERPYKAFGYPLLQIIYFVIGLWFCAFLLIYKPVYALSGLLITLAGIPIYYIVRRKKYFT